MSELDPAVEAIINVLHNRDCGDRCEPHTYAATYLPTAEAILTAAAPLIAAQATADLRARIEALRDEWQRREQAEGLAATHAPLGSAERLVRVTNVHTCRAHADALDALNAGGEG